MFEKYYGSTRLIQENKLKIIIKQTMKKLIFMCLALMSIVLMTSCSSCKGQDEKTEDVTLITSSDFNTNVLKIDSVMRHQYPDFVFFEA